MKLNVDNITFSFSSESIRANYLNKDGFVSEMTASYAGICEASKLKKVLDKAWKEACLKSDESTKGDEPIKEGAE
jgi:hypothetical protein